MNIKRLSSYKAQLCRINLRPNTIQVYMRIAQRLEIFCEDNVNKKKVSEFFRYLLNHYKPTSYNLYVIAANKYLRWCGYDDISMNKTIIHWKRDLEDVLTPNEYHRLLNYAYKTNRLKYYIIMQILAHTGIRVSELQFITYESLKKGFVSILSKGRIRKIYMSDSLITQIENYCIYFHITSGFIIRGRNNLPLTRNAIWHMLTKMAAELGISGRKARPHSFRHLFAKTYIQQYGDITELADILGHSCLETTRIYTKTSLEEKRERLEHLDL